MGEYKRTLEEEERLMKQYGTNFDLREPNGLGERRARANYWRLNNNFRMLLDVVIGKQRKFDKLWDQFNEAQTEEERLKIVQKMEKMYPTTEKAIRKVEEKTGYRK